MDTTLKGPICIIGIDSKQKADFIIKAKFKIQKLCMWPEIEDSIPLHPYHLKIKIEQILFDKEDILIVTQSPIVISCFNSIPENVFVVNRVGVHQLTTKFDANWLKRFDLGNLYVEMQLEDKFFINERIQKIMNL